VNTVSVINTTTNVIATTFAVGNLPTMVAITPDGSRAYVINSASATVSVINTATDGVIATISLL